jgi:hypothetical protein
MPLLRVKNKCSDQFEFTIASLVLLGKISSSDVKHIIKKFKTLTTTNKIKASDVAGPSLKKEPESNLEALAGQLPLEIEDTTKTAESPLRLSTTSTTSSAISVGKKIALAFKEELLGASTVIDEDDMPDEVEATVDYNRFTLPKNTFAIGKSFVIVLLMIYFKVYSQHYCACTKYQFYIRYRRQ